MTYSEQFSKYANVFFLFTALIQQIPNVSPTNQYTTVAPLGAVLLASAFKEIQEDRVGQYLDTQAQHSQVFSETPPIGRRVECKQSQSSNSAGPLRGEEMEGY